VSQAGEPEGPGAGALRLSVVVVTYQSAESLPALLDALAPQLAEGDEVIVVDNASRDGTAAIAAAHPAVGRVVEPGGNVGFAAGCNAGAREATGDAVLLLNPDAVPEPGFLEALRRPPQEWDAWMGLVLLADGGQVNTAGGEVHYLGFAWAGRYGRPAGEIPAAPHEVGFLSGACMAVRRGAWERLGGFPVSFFMYGEDVDLSLRLRLAGHRFGLVPGARCRHDYAFDKGDTKWRLLERNRWLLVLRTYPRPLLLRVLPLMLLAEPALLVLAIASGWGRAKLRSWLGVLAASSRVRAERDEVQRSVRVGVRSFAAALTPALDSPFLGAAGRSRVLRILLAAYWRIARIGLRDGAPPR
jgi:N-acetylglucosaminyl-diphospho-decaprenol L-rhamnosyltransferase